MFEPQIGDYVLATKYSDGDPSDQFCVGFYAEKTWHGRFIVVDSEGKPFRQNGFRRIQRITSAQGSFIIQHFREIEAGDRSVWEWLRVPLTVVQK